ncbi:MAG: zinc ribbon domain-containing protein [Bacteroidales bacterium]|nr:zinc ribbon domain-containing protein [Bacteroidales bacterium]
MSISKHIADLTRLALLDRVLTYRERETILIEARAEGIPDAETNAFLDGMLAQRLKSYSKEELKACPACGAQIPLISDQCLFCGTMLEKPAQNTAKTISVKGSAADIIRSENVKNTQAEQNIKNCPNCGAPFPLLSNICPHCQHVLHAAQDSDLNIKSLIENISKSTAAISVAPKPSFLDVLKYHRGAVMLFIGVVIFVSAFSYPGATAGCLLLFGILLGFFGARGKILGKDLTNTENSPVTIADEYYYTALYDHDKYVRLTQSVYGDNREAKQYLAQLGGEIRKAEQNRKSNRLKLAIFVTILVIISLLPLLIKPSVATYYEEYLEPNYTIFETNQQPINDENY